MQKKRKGAVALAYSRIRDDAPKVAASGQGAVADKILAIARKAGVPVREDPDLLEVLAQVPVGQEIPPELYQAVAEILAFIYRVNTQCSNKQDMSNL